MSTRRRCESGRMYRECRGRYGLVLLVAAFACRVSFGGVSIWVSVGGNNGAIKVDTNGAILATTAGVAQTFESMVVSAFTGDLFAWNNVSGDGVFASALYRFNSGGSLIASLGSLRQSSPDFINGGIPQKKMVLDPLANNVLFVPGGYYYPAEDGWYDGIQRFEWTGATITQTLDKKLGSAAFGATAVDADYDTASRKSLVYVAMSSVLPTNLLVYEATSDFSSPITGAANDVPYKIRAMAEYRGTNTMAVVSCDNSMKGWNPASWTIYGSTPSIAPDPPFGPQPQTSPSTNGTWWNYFVGNPNFSSSSGLDYSPATRGIVVDDKGYMWLSTYGVSSYANKLLIRLNLADGSMAPGFPITLTNEPSIGLALDNEGCVWMGTTNGCLYRFNTNGGLAGGSGTNLVYNVPSGALVYTDPSARSLVLGGGDATGYDHARKYVRPPARTIIYIK